MSAKITISFDSRNKKSPHSVRWWGDEINPKTGRPRCYGKSFRTKAEARQFAAEKRIEIKRGVNLDRPRDVTIGSYREYWLRVRQSEVRVATLECYENTFVRLETFFGRDCPLRKIKTDRAREFIAGQQNITNPSKVLSDWSRDQIKRNAKSIFNIAVEDGLIIKNPFGPLQSKKLSSNRWYRVSPAEYLSLLDAAPSLREKIAYALLYTGGLRLSEAFSLTWDCIDFENGKLRIINRASTKDIPPFAIKDHEARQIPLPEDTIDLLTEWQGQAPESVPFILLSPERYERVKAKWCRLQKESKPWRNRCMVNNVLRNFKSHYKRAGIKPVGSLTIHTLRKSCGQNWADDNPMNAVKEWMGHSNIATTAKFYNQVDEVHEKKASSVAQQRIEEARKQSKSYVSDTYERNLVEKGASD